MQPDAPATDDAHLADLRRQAEAMDGPITLPRGDDGEPVFDEPWQGRLVATTMEAVHRRSLGWDRFRNRLIAAIEDRPERPYYESWLSAFEELVADETLADAAELEAARRVAASYRTTEVRDDDLEVFPLDLGADQLVALVTELFTDHWHVLRFGPLIDGAAYELAATAPPRLSMLDGYLTVDLGASHLHLCLAPHTGLTRPVSAELARRRRCRHVELQRLWTDGAPRSWMLRLFNGAGEQQITFLLPNPFLDDDQRPRPEPDWSRLALWDSLRARHLQLGPDPADRLGERFVHA